MLAEFELTRLTYFLKILKVNAKKGKMLPSTFRSVDSEAGWLIMENARLFYERVFERTSWAILRFSLACL